MESRFGLLINKCQNPTARARLLGGASKESGVWLNAPLVSSLGLRMDNDCISICVSLVVPLCHPHLYHQCGSPVDEYALHGLSCVKSQGRHPRHNNLNEIILSSLTAAGVPSQKEPYGLARSDGKCPGGMMMMPWSYGCSLIWDATCSDTFGKSYLHEATNRPGAVIDLAESRKVEMHHHFEEHPHHCTGCSREFWSFWLKFAAVLEGAGFTSLLVHREPLCLPTSVAATISCSATWKCHISSWFQAL